MLFLTSLNRVKKRMPISSENKKKQDALAQKIKILYPTWDDLFESHMLSICPTMVLIKFIIEKYPHPRFLPLEEMGAIALLILREKIFSLLIHEDVHIVPSPSEVESFTRFVYNYPSPLNQWFHEAMEISATEFKKGDENGNAP